jgi:hypothetical protein
MLIAGREWHGNMQDKTIQERERDQEWEQERHRQSRSPPAPRVRRVVRRSRPRCCRRAPALPPIVGRVPPLPPAASPWPPVPSGSSRARQIATAPAAALGRPGRPPHTTGWPTRVTQEFAPRPAIMALVMPLVEIAGPYCAFDDTNGSATLLASMPRRTSTAAATATSTSTTSNNLAARWTSSTPRSWRPFATPPATWREGSSRLPHRRRRRRRRQAGRHCPAAAPGLLAHCHRHPQRRRRHRLPPGRPCSSRAPSRTPSRCTTPRSTAFAATRPPSTCSRAASAATSSPSPSRYRAATRTASPAPARGSRASTRARSAVRPCRG